MDQFYQDVCSDLFYYWVIGKKNEFDKHHINISEELGENNIRIIRFELVNATAYLKIWIDNIVEEEIVDTHGEHLFYLHYHINDIRQCRYLFYEFYKVILHHNNQTKINVALCCSGGLSTSLFSIKLSRNSLLIPIKDLLSLEENHISLKYFVPFSPLDSQNFLNSSTISKK